MSSCTSTVHGVSCSEASCVVVVGWWHRHRAAPIRHQTVSAAPFAVRLSNLCMGPILHQAEWVTRSRVRKATPQSH